MLTAARAALFALVPAELLLAILLVCGAALPGSLVVAAESAATTVFILEAAVACRLFRAARRTGADRRAALAAAADLLVPERVRRVLTVDARGLASLALWALRRRDGVPPGATAVPYSGGQTGTMALFLFALVLDTVCTDLLLRGVGVPEGVRIAVFVADAYSALFVLAVIAGCATRPHVVSDGELRVRYGVFFDVRIPHDRIASARPARNFDEKGLVKVDGDRLAVAVSAQTNVIVDLVEPMTVVRPLGRRARVRTIRFFADRPDAALAALRAHLPAKTRT